MNIFEFQLFIIFSCGTLNYPSLSHLGVSTIRKGVVESDDEQDDRMGAMSIFDVVRLFDRISFTNDRTKVIASNMVLHLCISNVFVFLLFKHLCFKIFVHCI